MSTPRGEHLPSSTPLGLQGRQVALVDLLDRVLAGGVVVAGEITLCIADVDLVRISLRALVASIRAASNPDTAGQHPDETPEGNFW
ncbi:gas vesicle protein [Streptomyces silvisoli]|uniref:Gas vesicle protein n=1 Tax=Streptomyces silvisoli TaxID=3034235 RepID=A0ABT5ZTT6_9ACTN|nr:gas vesicle protein [Streptomyces silvisoli]MDF3293020.1 gas vesicle protein [Streptomyces silvisoli]